ncbi:hypothetical protein H4582DRAFT_2128612 [Lactarius indigo]|nr:hypothetical protein H4582DRAFT_2128612 [Lactarius indigo]
MSTDTPQTLQIAAITLASLSGLFGVYFVLFVFAVWSTYRQGSLSLKRLRWVTILLFIILLVHFITRALEFSRVRLQNDSDTELLRWSIPLTVVGNVTTTSAALLCDGTLAWRFYVIFGKKKWALYLPATAVVVNALLCWSADAQHLAIYFNRNFYENTLLPVTLDITVAWGWFIFLINTLLTGGILYKHTLDKLLCLRNDGQLLLSSQKYDNALRAVIEAALVTWIGILIYEITSLAPMGHITTNLNVGYVMLQIIPIFFGISQSLITARHGLTRETLASESAHYQLSQLSCHLNRRMPTYNAFADTSTNTVSQAEVPGVKTVTKGFAIELYLSVSVTLVIDVFHPGTVRRFHETNILLFTLSEEYLNDATPWDPSTIRFYSLSARMEPTPIQIVSARPSKATNRIETLIPSYTSASPSLACAVLDSVLLLPPGLRLFPVHLVRCGRHESETSSTYTNFDLLCCNGTKTSSRFPDPILPCLLVRVAQNPAIMSIRSSQQLWWLVVSFRTKVVEPETQRLWRVGTKVELRRFSHTNLPRRMDKVGSFTPWYNTTDQLPSFRCELGPNGLSASKTDLRVDDPTVIKYLRPSGY